ncbi:MAG TPA: EAL domain-containing protein [Solirubrobacterales bacterium]
MNRPRDSAADPLSGIGFERIVDSIPGVVWTAAPDGTPEYFSRHGAEYTGLESGGHGWDLRSLVHPDDQERSMREWRGAVSRRAPFSIKLRLRRHDGAYRRHLLRALPVWDSAGEVVKWAGTATDIEERHLLEERLRQAERRAAESLSLLETLQSASPAGLGFCDRDFRLIRVNEALAAINGVQPEQQIGRTIAEVVPDLWPQLEPAYRSVLETGEPVVNAETTGVLQGFGEERAWLTSLYPVRLDEEVIGIGIIVVDITERKAMERRLEILADRDPLTGLYNRRRLLLELERVLANAARYHRSGAVLVVDIDNFKLTNDSYGHLAGDRQLLSVAQVLAKRLRKTDIVARTGGDEFAVILPEATAKQAMAVAVDVRSRLFERPFGPPVHISIGIAVFDGTEKVSTDDLLAAADTAMYRSKEEGGDRTTLYDGLASDVLSRARQVQDALGDERFVIYSQPIVSLRNGRVDHRELLIRMLSEDGEIVPPDEFMPIAEEFSLVGRIDRWVVGEALAFARHEPVSVNLSGRSVGDPQILSGVREAIEAGLDPGNLTFELTETAVTTDFDRAQAFVSALAELGCDIALDDFGTGFGTFLYLKSLPARYLKIDTEFVRDINDDPIDRLIVELIVRFAHALGKETIAEGVETAGVLEALRELGVDCAQGWHLGPPEPAWGQVLQA